MSTLNAWDIVDANNDDAPPDGWPESTMNYSDVNDAGRAVQGTLKRYFADVNGSLVAGGIADAYTVTLNETGYLAYFTGMYFACKINATNTGATTMNVNAIGVVDVVDRAGNALDGGEIIAGGIFEFRYDGTEIQLMGTSNTVASGVAYAPAGTGAVSTTVQAKLRESVSVFDFMTAAEIADVQAGTALVDVKTAVQATIDAVSAAGGGEVLFPVGTYAISAEITMKTNVKYKGTGGFASAIKFTGGSGTAFNFLGTSEAEGLNAEFENLQIYSSAALTGVGIRVRNFLNLSIKNCNIWNFDQGIWADWGIGVYINESSIVLNTRGVQVGGGTGGIRVASPPYDTSPYLDSVVIRNSVFSQNEIDINDMGSQLALGGLTIEDNSFYHKTAIAAKGAFIRITARNGSRIKGNWFENFIAGDSCIVYSAFDYDAVLRVVPRGGRVEANHFRVQGGANSTGVDVERSTGLGIDNNTFEWGNAVGGYGINLQDTTDRVIVGENVYVTYDSGGFTSFVNQATDYNVFLSTDHNQRALGTPNFITLPGGLIIQYEAIDLSGGSGLNTWTYPKAFPNAVFQVTCIPLWAGNDLTTNLNSLTGLTAAIFRNSDGAGHAVTGYCMAIGY